jgi:hypothetical protein
LKIPDQNWASCPISHHEKMVGYIRILWSNPDNSPVSIPLEEVFYMPWNPVLKALSEHMTAHDGSAERELYFYIN